MRGCCICVTGEIKDLSHPWRHHREVGDDYEIRPVYHSVYMVRPILAAGLNNAAMSLLSANFPIYGDVLLVRIIEGFMVDITFDDIASEMITEIRVVDSEQFPNPVGSDISSDDFDELDESQYDSN